MKYVVQSFFPYEGWNDEESYDSFGEAYDAVTTYTSSVMRIITVHWSKEFE